MTKPALRIMAARHSAFYSPLIAAMAAGFLESEGFDATYQVLPPGGRSHELIRAGAVDIVQSAVSSSWGLLEQGLTDLPAHFVQINQRDGFFLTAREPDPAFHWRKLEGRTLLADHAFQPLAMLKYAAHCQGVDWSRLQVEDAGGVEEIDAAFRAGRGDYVHQQGPAAQQIERDGVGQVVASAGEAMPAVAFSSLQASRDFLKTESARAFRRAYGRARAWVQQAPAAEIAGAEARYFPGIDREALTAAIARYQALGCWQGGTEIQRALYDQALEVFLHCGAIPRRYRYEEVVAELA